MPLPNAEKRSKSNLHFKYVKGFSNAVRRVVTIDEFI